MGCEDSAMSHSGGSSELGLSHSPEASFLSLHCLGAEAARQFHTLLRAMGISANMGDSGAICSAEELMSWRNQDSRTALHKACELGLCHAAATLICMSGAEAVNVEDDMRSTPLHAAVQSESVGLVQFLLQRGANAAKADRSGVSPLHYAAAAGNLEIIEMLLENNARIDSLSGAGTPLHWAAGENRPEAVKMLLHRGANKDALDSDGISPLSMAIVSGAEEVACVLLDAGASVSNRGLPPGMSLLHYSAELGLDQVVNRLLATPYGKAAAHQEVEGRLPVHIAAEAGYEEIAQTLLPESGLAAGTTVAQVMEVAHSIGAAEWDVYTSEEESPFRLDSIMSLSDAGTSTAPTPGATPMSISSIGRPGAHEFLSSTPVSPVLEATRPSEPVAAATSPGMLADAADNERRGDILMAENDFKGAVQSYTDAIMCHGTDANLWGKRAGARLVHAQSIGEPCRQQVMKAHGDAVVATEIDSKSPLARLVLGKALLLLGHVEDAEVQFSITRELTYQTGGMSSEGGLGPLLVKLESVVGMPGEAVEKLKWTPHSRCSPLRVNLRLSSKNPVSPLKQQLKKMGRSAQPIVTCPTGLPEEQAASSPFSKMRSSLRPMRLRMK